MQSSLIEIKVGDPVIELESGRVGVLRDMKLTPNGINDPKLLVILFVEMDNPGKGTSLMSATSNKFRPLISYEYDELYPGVHLNRLIKKREAEVEEYKLSWS